MPRVHRTGKPAGRTKLRVAAVPDGYRIIEELASRGCSEVTIARALGMSQDTWRREKSEDPKAVEALERGRAVEHDSLVGKLYESAMKGNVVAALFLLKARHGYREGHTIEHQQNVRVTLELPAALDPNTYARVINPRPEALPPGDGADDASDEGTDDE